MWVVPVDIVVQAVKISAVGAACAALRGADVAFWTGADVVRFMSRCVPFGGCAGRGHTRSRGRRCHVRQILLSEGRRKRPRKRRRCPPSVPYRQQGRLPFELQQWPVQLHWCRFRAGGAHAGDDAESRTRWVRSLVCHTPLHIVSAGCSVCLRQPSLVA